MEEEGKAILVNELDFNFREEIASQSGGENIMRCYACGTCAANCPITEIDERFNPRRIIRMALLGMKSEVLSSDFIWICCNCYQCYERCPQDVRFTSIIHAIRNIAIREIKKGKGPIMAPGFLFASSFLETVKDFGRVWEPGLMFSFFCKKAVSFLYSLVKRDKSTLASIYKEIKGALAYAPLAVKMYRKGKVPILPIRGGMAVKRIFMKIKEREER